MSVNLLRRYRVWMVHEKEVIYLDIHGARSEDSRYFLPNWRHNSGWKKWGCPSSFFGDSSRKVESLVGQRLSFFIASRINYRILLHESFISVTKNGNIRITWMQDLQCKGSRAIELVPKLTSCCRVNVIVKRDLFRPRACSIPASYPCYIAVSVSLNAALYGERHFLRQK